MGQRWMRAAGGSGSAFALAFEFDQRLNAEMKRLGGRFQHASREWIVHFGSATEVRTFAAAERFAIHETAERLIAELDERERQRRESEGWATHAPRTTDPVEICRWIGEMPELVLGGFCAGCDSNFTREWCLVGKDPRVRKTYELFHVGQLPGSRLYTSEVKILLAALDDRRSYGAIRDAMQPRRTSRGTAWFWRS